MNCVIYARVSTDEQANDKCSIPTQISKCKAAIKEKGYSLLETFQDEGRSGSDPKRPGLVNMVDYCQTKKVDKVFVLDTDRFARDENIHFGVKAILWKHGTKVEAVNQPMLDDSVEGKFLDSILAAVNAFYPKLTGRKTQMSMDEKVKLGWWPGPAASGYKNIKNKKVESGFEKNIIAEDNLVAPFITKMFNLYATGGYTIYTLSQKLYEEGLRNKNGRVVKASEIHHRLRNVFYTGRMLYKGVVRPAKHKPLINIKTFEKCQRILDDHNNFADRKRKHKFVLSGCIICDICGRVYTAEKQGEIAYYHCPSKNHSNRHQNIRTAELEKFIEKLFKAITLSSDLVIRIRERAEYKLSDIHNNIDGQKRLLCLRKQQLEERRRTLEIRYLDNKVNDDTYTRQSTEISEDIKKIDETLVKINDHREDNIKIFERLVELSHDLYTVYKNASPDQRKYYVKLFWDEIRVKDRKIKKAVPTKMFRTLLNSKSVKFDEMPFSGSFRKNCDWLPGSDSNGRPYPYTDLLIT